MSRPTAELDRAYRATSYKVFDPPLTIRIGAWHPDLDALLDDVGAGTWAFITACNPEGQVHSAEENLQLQEELELALQEYRLYKGEGIGDVGGWPPEPSVLVVGISPEKARQMAGQFRQWALLTGCRSEPAQLEWLVPPL